MVHSVILKDASRDKCKVGRVLKALNLFNHPVFLHRSAWLKVKKIQSEMQRQIQDQILKETNKQTPLWAPMAVISAWTHRISWEKLQLLFTLKLTSSD